MQVFRLEDGRWVALPPPSTPTARAATEIGAFGTYAVFGKPAF